MAYYCILGVFDIKGSRGFNGRGLQEGMVDEPPFTSRHQWPGVGVNGQEGAWVYAAGFSWGLGLKPYGLMCGGNMAGLSG